MYEINYRIFNYIFNFLMLCLKWQLCMEDQCLNNVCLTFKHIWGYRKSSSFQFFAETRKSSTIDGYFKNIREKMLKILHIFLHL